MSRTAIVTDSTADLSVTAAESHGIRVVPLHVQFGDESFQVGFNLTTEQFWERLLAPGAPMPSTASPSPGAFRDAFQACFADGADAVICPVIGSRISSTFQSASLAAQLLPGREIHVIDTGSTSMATGFPALIAAELAAAGMPAADVASAVRDRLPDVDLYVAVDTLEYLRRNGRLSGARAMVGTVLSVKPIITVRGGDIVVAEQPRTRTKARRRAIELITARPLERAAILHTPTSTPEEVADFRDALLAQAPDLDPSCVTVGLLGASTGPHLGPGLIGAVFVRRR